MIYLYVSENKEQEKLNISIKKEIMTIRAEINDMSIKRITQKVNETKSWFFEKTIKIERSLESKL